MKLHGPKGRYRDVVVVVVVSLDYNHLNMVTVFLCPPRGQDILVSISLASKGSDHKGDYGVGSS